MNKRSKLNMLVSWSDWEGEHINWIAHVGWVGWVWWPNRAKLVGLLGRITLNWMAQCAKWSLDQATIGRLCWRDPKCWMDWGVEKVFRLDEAAQMNTLSSTTNWLCWTCKLRWAGRLITLVREGLLSRLGKKARSLKLNMLVGLIRWVYWIGWAE